MAGLDWLTARPIAHRGLHDAAAGAIENTATAVARAIASNFAVEVDLQVTADGEAVVFHDATLERLTERHGRLDAMTAAELAHVRLRQTDDRIIRLGELCDLVGGRATLLLEMKSRFDGDPRLPLRVADVLRRYFGPVAAMSFDPAQVLTLREAMPSLARGLTAGGQRRTVPGAGRVGYVWNAVRMRAQFLAHAVDELPAALPLMARHVLRLPVLAWTVRTEADRARAARWADQMIFEGFRP